MFGGHLEGGAEVLPYGRPSCGARLEAFSQGEIY